MNITLTPVRFLERTTRIFGHRPAVICGLERFNYISLGKRIYRLARFLRESGVGQGDRVAYLGYNCHRLLESYYASPILGAILVPTNIRLLPKEFAYILNDCTPKVLLLDPDFVPHIESVKGLINVEKIILLRDMLEPPNWTEGIYDQLIGSGEDSPLYPRNNYPFNENDTAEIFYTSGTTGLPKGVMLTHRNLYLHALETLACLNVKETDVQLHLIPLFHVNGWGTTHFLTAKGGCHVMVQKFDPLDTLNLIQNEKVNCFFIVPTMVNALLSLKNLKEFDVSSVEEILIGGAPPPKGMCEKVSKAFPNAVVHGGFGMSETCPLIALPELTPKLDTTVFKHRAWETWGFSLIGTEFRVIDISGNDLPWDGESVGELLIRGDQVMKGYYNKPEETREALEGGWYHSGDLVSMGSDGSLYIKDRLKDIIISGGENISSLEVEQVLYGLDDILECAVVGKRDEKWGEVPVAFVVLKPGSRLNPEEIINYAMDNLAHFKIPKEVKTLNELPKGGTKKILKSELRKMVNF